MPEMTTSTVLDLLSAFKKLNIANSALVTKLAELIIAGAQTGLDTVDSALIIEVLREHHKTINDINEKLLGK